MGFALLLSAQQQSFTIYNNSKFAAYEQLTTDALVPLDVMEVNKICQMRLLIKSTKTLLGYRMNIPLANNKIVTLSHSSLIPISLIEMEADCVYVLFAPLDFLVGGKPHNVSSTTMLYNGTSYLKEYFINSKMRDDGNYAFYQAPYIECVEPSLVKLRTLCKKQKNIKKIMFMGTSHGGTCAQIACIMGLIDTNLQTKEISCFTFNSVPSLDYRAMKKIQPHLTSFIACETNGNVVTCDPCAFIMSHNGQDVAVNQDSILVDIHKKKAYTTRHILSANINLKRPTIPMISAMLRLHPLKVVKQSLNLCTEIQLIP